MKSIELGNSTWQLRLLPEWGGRIAALRAGGLDLLLPITADAFDPLDWPRAGAYPLMPYSNRLRDARLAFNGVEHRLPAHPAARPHTLHGVTHTRPWEVVSADAGQALIRCDYDGEHWPWAFRAEQAFALDGDRLEITLRVTNLGDTPMPAGLGLHPYFQRHPGMRAEYRVGREWAIDEEYLVTGDYEDAVKTVHLIADNAAPVAHYQSHWDGELHLSYPEGRLLMRASLLLNHFVAFAPPGSAYLCLEPVSHVADAFNGPPADWAESGTHELAPGQSLEATLSFTWQR
ncbi:MAG: aldose 1-epimerase [Paucimonas sp.]|jgi:aldose 1-epimerase|nr:aldose 1-epimerase [Paucimonas sp.]